ncbi:hypothetical protein [Viridibacillus arvi]|uniref:hypothetical protein n=1 Tax=Viridibacillus arvi TaxID=263475 RepID=UPI0034CF1351
MIKIAETKDDYVEWNSVDPSQARLGILTKNKNHPLISSIKRRLPKETVVFHVKAENELNSEKDGISISEFESLPSADTESVFAMQRMNWVQNYLKLICYINGRERSDFIPTAGFKSHEEGPLMGYIRATESMLDLEDKALLKHHLEKLDHVEWSRSEEAGFTFHIQGKTEGELLESLYLAAWSFWTFAVSVTESNPLCFILELDEIMLEHPVLNEKRELINFIVQTMGHLTFDYVASFIVKAPNLYPIPEANVEYLLVENIESKDIDWNGTFGTHLSLNSSEVVVIKRNTYKIMNLFLESSIQI